MARRSRKKKQSNSQTTVIIGIAVIALAGYLGFKVIGSSDKVDAKEFPLQSYVNDGNSLRGNKYQVTGEVFSKPFHDPARGQKIYVRVDVGEAKYPAGLPRDIGIFVPSTVQGPNLETKQNYTFVVKVINGGNLEALQYASQ
ncbi:hypothetical protein SAMN02745181_2658 [Rubritalea squalenifaciens DSM 18772]|uniref:Uncharacterized protein n=2 Tax=Rubritalea TaxID=361050 RepID=A0A1M6M9L8_9BACT|nr:hypothetical protein [Rubritalea squalenifaciens]SHJ80175.1 hypothetical protein SAMN02745181_2658 [Rubritalea squalenifaciens DSM 18772]